MKMEKVWLAGWPLIGVRWLEFLGLAKLLLSPESGGGACQLGLVILS
jgi:hypothetical protein